MICFNIHIIQSYFQENGFKSIKKAFFYPNKRNSKIPLT
ncbi:hypothetical protein NT05LM_0703 [Listeria marthii FSL S4-120]|uniref:Uncharacterized protein n=1 Tax=Listeria marthii FSL S4-120 TaxID=702457 RepID=A0ABN0BZU1_9LIST|nr:hypothetical protein NT05LM_0703 [Listeria marthii FSL S4-120]